MHYVHLEFFWLKIFQHAPILLPVYRLVSYERYAYIDSSSAIIIKTIITTVASSEPADNLKTEEYHCIIVWGKNSNMRD